MQSVVVSTEDLSSAMEQLKAGKSMAEGQVVQLAAELKGVREELAEARETVHQLRNEQARTSMRAEAVLRLITELASIRQSYEVERQAQVSAEQAEAVAQALKDEIERRLVATTSQAAATRKPVQRRPKTSS